MGVYKNIRNKHTCAFPQAFSNLLLLLFLAKWSNACVLKAAKSKSMIKRTVFRKDQSIGN